MRLMDAEQLNEALQALEKALALYLYDPNVSLIDMGYRIKDSEGGKIVDQPAVRIHVRKKLRGRNFEEFRERFPGRVFTAERIGFEVDVPEAPYYLNHWYYWNVRTPLSERAQRFDPLKGGISISNTLLNGYGTLGGKVIDRQTGEPMILSNWHVLAGSWIIDPNVEILQPGKGDGGTEKDVIARFSRHAFAWNLDAAVARLLDQRQCVNEQLDFGPVKGAKSPALNMSVMKSGRRTEITRGVVTGIEGQAVFRYGGFARTVKHVFHIVPSERGKEVSGPGDSGSWWLEEGTHCAVGLHFAGANYPEYALALSMPKVLEALEVDIADE